MAASSSSSSAAAAADPSLLKYDVFISFRGETRNSFTSHLYSALCQKHIKAYIDEVRLAKGDDISRALPKAIEESAISIIILSENYADSRWCLDELVHILKCKEEKDQIVLPIFYGIDPSHIRHQKGTYAAAFVKHQGRFKDEMEKVEEWRQALTRAAALSGWDSRGKSESVLVQKVVEDVNRNLESIFSSLSIDDLKGLVGIRRQFREVESRLCFDSPNVRIILGIWGMGGIGKTTLARVAFQCFSNRFEGACFLESVREQSQRKGLAKLEKEVFSKLLREKDPDVYNPHVNYRLSQTKALLVLDDVDNFVQLERLAGDHNRFGPGSKIIVTSRNWEVLNQLTDVRYYEVQAIDRNEASQLFCLKAFEENSDRTGYEEISAEVVRFTGGNPLALKILGAYFKSFGREDWKRILEKLKRTPHVDIQKVLRISYDGLDTEEQDMFLDIACFLKDERKDSVESILEDKSIKGLVHKSLITIDQHGFIRMHDLIQEMGWEIVRQSTKKLGKCSRLWTTEDVSNVLENNKGTEAIEAICLPWMKEVHLRPDVFEEMTKLRLLKIYDARDFRDRSCKVEVYIDGDLKYLPIWLRYLHWESYPGKSLPSNFKPHNLVELRMRSSKLEQLWDGVQKLGSLKRINLSCSKLLTKLPDLSLAPKLESIDLFLCESLIHIPKLPRNIEVLNLQGTSIQELPSTIENLIGLRDLDLNSCIHLEFIPETLGRLTRLQEIVISDNSKLESFPMLHGACSLTRLFLRDCNIREIPDWLGSLTSLTVLVLEGNLFDRIPASIGMLSKLKELDVSNCKNLQSLPELPLFVESVKADGCSSLEMVSTSTSTLGRCLHRYDSDRDSDIGYQGEFSFLKCTNLCEDAIDNIFREFLYKVFCMATTPPEVVYSVSEMVIGELVVCYPTKEIPWCFNNQSEGCSITIALPPNWYNPKTFLGFVVSVVVDEDDYALGEDGAMVECELRLIRNKDSFRGDVFEKYAVTSCLDHIAMWYKYFDHSRASFDKYISLEFRSYGRVKRCGVRMLYLKDAVEESDDGTTANFESRRTDVINSDTDYAATYNSDEPPPKRARNLGLSWRE